MIDAVSGRASLRLAPARRLAARRRGPGRGRTCGLTAPGVPMVRPTSATEVPLRRRCRAAGRLRDVAARRPGRALAAAWRWCSNGCCSCWRCRPCSCSGRPGRCWFVLRGRHRWTRCLRVVVRPVPAIAIVTVVAVATLDHRRREPGRPFVDRSGVARARRAGGGLRPLGARAARAARGPETVGAGTGGLPDRAVDRAELPLHRLDLRSAPLVSAVCALRERSSA